jgi:hypothetical protein
MTITDYCREAPAIGQQGRMAIKEMSLLLNFHCVTDEENIGRGEVSN